ncbi:MAG: phage portal protein [Dermabacter sp.]|nr:phage portal protein [Dermabacter sp.]
MRSVSPIMGITSIEKSFPAIQLGEIPELSDAINADIAEMQAQLSSVADRNYTRSTIYNAEQEFENMGVAIPAAFEEFANVLGWNAKAVDTLARRIKWNGLVTEGTPDRYSGLDRVFRETRFFSQLKMSIQSMLIHGTSFVGVVKNGTNVRVHGLSARHATGLWDPYRHGKLRCGMAVLDWGVTSVPVEVMLFYPDAYFRLTRKTGRDRWHVDRFPNPTGQVTLHPLAFLAQLDKPWGQSRINRPMIGLTKSAARTFLRSEVSAEFYSFPQLYALNMAPEDAEKFVTSIGRFFAIDYERDEDGAPLEGAPPVDIKQVQVASQQPHLDQLRTIAMMYAAETNLSPDKLGVIHDNPSSADAIDRADGELNAIAEEACRDLSDVVLDIVQSIWGLENSSSQLPDEIVHLTCDWADPGLTTRYSQRMAVSSLATAGLVVPGAKVTYEAAGFSETDATRMAAAWEDHERRKNQQAIAEQALAARSSSTTGPLIAAREAGA